MAIDADKDLKNFIQDHLVSLVCGEKKEQNTSTNVKWSCQVAMEHNDLRLGEGKGLDALNFKFYTNDW